MNKMNAAQILLDGSEEAPAKDSGGIIEFMRVSQVESGLLLVNQAALVLDVSHTRVRELISVGKLRSWDFFGKSYLSAREIDTRRTSEIKTGRPPRSFGQRLKVGAKLVASMNGKQLAAVLVE
jgi:hypothetical protein